MIGKAYNCLKERLARYNMSPEGYVEYKRREFCKDIKCPLQLKLQTQTENSPEYEKTRIQCSTACLYTTWQFHHWLIEKGYLILKPTASSER